MTQPSITDWMQGIGSLVAIALSLGSLIWQWRTARKTNEDRLTCEATRFGPEVWRMVVTFDADHRSSPPMLTMRVRNPRTETALVGSDVAVRRLNPAGQVVTDIGPVFDVVATRKLSIEMAFRPAPSREATVALFVRHPVEDEPMKVTLEVRTGGLFPAAKRAIPLTPLE